MSSAYRYTDNETKRRSSALATDETPERPRRRPADYHRDLVFYIAPGPGFDFYGSFWKNAIIRDVTDPQKDFIFEATFPSRRQFDLIRRLVNFRRVDFLKDTFRKWCEQFQWCEQYRRMEQTREVISLPRRVPKERECTVICPYCKGKYRGEHGLATHQKSSQKCTGIRFAAHVNKNTTPCPHCETPIYKGVDGMGMIAHLIECYERIQHDQRRAIREDILRPIQHIIQRLRICLSVATLAEKKIWKNTFTRWMERVDSDSTQSMRICNLVCALEEQGYLMRLPPPASTRNRVSRNSHRNES